MYLHNEKCPTSNRFIKPQLEFLKYVTTPWTFSKTLTKSQVKVRFAVHSTWKRTGENEGE